MIDFFLNLIFPDICGFCGKIDKNCLCENCAENLKKYEINKIENYTNNNKEVFDFLICIFKYENIVRRKIIEYKFNEKSYLYKTFSKMILKNKKICSFLKNYDIMIPIPAHKNKKRLRGYNQTELIAKHVAKEIGIIFSSNNLVKVVDNKTQSTLSKPQRKDNVKDIFNVENPEIIQGKNIILFDDIYTTGATVTERCQKIKTSRSK